MTDTNILFCSCGRRGRLMLNAKKSLGPGSLVAGTNCFSNSPALMLCDKAFTVPKVITPGYVDIILGICRENGINVITSLIDCEIEILAAEADRFRSEGILPLLPSLQTARLCFDKYAFYKHLTANHIPTPLTYSSLDDFERARRDGEIDFPVFMKPACGCGSIGAHRVDTPEQLRRDCETAREPYIIQELMTGADCDVDLYVDALSRKPVSVFAKRKIARSIGGATQTVAFKDDRVVELVGRLCSLFEFCGPVDIDLFERDGQFYVSEINPRFGGAYLHAYGVGIDFFRMISNNLRGVENPPQIGCYEPDTVMMMYDDVVITSLRQLPGTTINSL